jgi:hypothetical protein
MTTCTVARPGRNRDVEALAEQVELGVIAYKPDLRPQLPGSRGEFVGELFGAVHPFQPV